MRAATTIDISVAKEHARKDAHELLQQIHLRDLTLCNAQEEEEDEARESVDAGVRKATARRGHRRSERVGVGRRKHGHQHRLILGEGLGRHRTGLDAQVHEDAEEFFSLRVVCEAARLLEDGEILRKGAVVGRLLILDADPHFEQRQHLLAILTRVGVGRCNGCGGCSSGSYALRRRVRPSTHDDERLARRRRERQQI